jgi:hypothetical protein
MGIRTASPTLISTIRHTSSTCIITLRVFGSTSRKPLGVRSERGRPKAPGTTSTEYPMQTGAR